MEKKQNPQSVDIMQSLQNLLNENDIMRKELEAMRHKYHNIAYQLAEMAVLHRKTSEQLTTLAIAINGGPLNQVDAMRAPGLDSVPCAKPIKELTPAQLAAYEKRKSDTVERKKKEAKSEAIKSSWTPERRAKQAEIMRARRAHQSSAAQSNLPSISDGI